MPLSALEMYERSLKAMHDTPFYDPKHKQLKEAVEKHDKAQELMKNNAKGTEHHKTGLQLFEESMKMMRAVHGPVPAKK